MDCVRCRPNQNKTPGARFFREVIGLLRVKTWHPSRRSPKQVDYGLEEEVAKGYLEVLGFINRPQNYFSKLLLYRPQLDNTIVAVSCS
jgi:hypothetical protein